jgi:23S rRNA (guanosine2251-2'-O)-methyltransferase
MKDQGAQEAEGAIEGRHPVLEALKGGRPINKVLLAKDAARHSVIAQILHLARQQGIPVEVVDRRVLERLSATGHTQGVLAIAAAKSYSSLDELWERSRALGQAPLYVLLDGIEDPQNLGAIIRTADAAGVHGVVIPSRRAAGLTAAVARTSAGALEYVPVARVNNLHWAMKELGERGLWMVGLDAAADRDYTQADYRQPTALVIGAEGRGLSRLTKERCDMLVRIPMWGRIASLNASVAAALVMYEAMRQRSG